MCWDFRFCFWFFGVWLDDLLFCFGVCCLDVSWVWLCLFWFVALVWFVISDIGVSFALICSVDGWRFACFGFLFFGWFSLELPWVFLCYKWVWWFGFGMFGLRVVVS